MSMHCGHVTVLTNVRKHPNADSLLLGTCLRNTVCVSLDYTEGQVGVYFPVDLQVSVEFGEKNNLLRKKDENGNNIGGYLDPNKRNIKAITLRGEKSDGLFMPLNCLDYCFEDGNAAAHLNIGDTVSVVNGHDICQKYIPQSKYVRTKGPAKLKKRSAPIAPTFYEHADTEQLAYNLSAFHPGDEIEITLKMHGTSQRTGNLKVFQGYNDSFACRAGNAIRHQLNKMGVYHGEDKHDGEPIYGWGGVSGTRRVVMDTYEGGFYGSNEFRKQHAEFFEDKLWKGETVYYEVVGFTHTGAPIMAEVSNSKVNDKSFAKMWGKTTVFSYGCEPNGLSGDELLKVEQIAKPYGDETRVILKPQSDIYVYRMTMTNEDGEVVEYTPDFMRYRCEMMGVKTVPVLWKGVIPYTEDDLSSPVPGARIMLKDGINAGEWIINIAERFYEGADPIGKTHIREGVVVRILNRPKFTAYKHKNFHFKVLEGIAKDEATEPDMEEASGLYDENESGAES